MDRNRENKEGLILKESAKLFRHKGYSATTVDEIAAAAGILKGSLYHYFGSKEEILYKITRPALKVGVDLLSETVESDLTPEEKLRKALQHHFELVDQYLPGYFMLSKQDLNCVTSQMHAEMSPLFNGYVGLWQEIIAEGVSSGHFRPDVDSEIMAYAVLGMCVGAVPSEKGSDLPSLAQIAEQCIAFAIGGLSAHGAP